MDGKADVAHVRPACCFSAPHFPHLAAQHVCCALQDCNLAKCESKGWHRFKSINQSIRWQHNIIGCELQDRKEKDSFFNWFYFAINLGSFLAVTTLVYIQESVSWTIGFAIPAAAMLLAVVTFVAGSSKYVHVEPTERWATARQPVTSPSRCLLFPICCQRCIRCTDASFNLYQYKHFSQTLGSRLKDAQPSSENHPYTPTLQGLVL